MLLKQIVLEDKWVVGKPGMWENDEFSLKILLLKSIWMLNAEWLLDMQC